MIETVVSNARERALASPKLVTTPFFPAVRGEKDPYLVFMIMPFTESWSSETFGVIKSVAEEHDLRVERADDIFVSQSIVNDIWQYINKAGLVIADITVQNANVYYELGIAHTLGKEFTLIRQPTGDKTPFDISGLRYFEYELTPSKVEAFKDKLSKVFETYLNKYKLGK
jgi:hypothetical protein